MGRRALFNLLGPLTPVGLLNSLKPIMGPQMLNVNVLGLLWALSDLPTYLILVSLLGRRDEGGGPAD